jgi:hypothetical protein
LIGGAFNAMMTRGNEGTVNSKSFASFENGKESFVKDGKEKNYSMEFISTKFYVNTGVIMLILYSVMIHYLCTSVSNNTIN